MIDLEGYKRKLAEVEPLRITGRVRRADGLVIESDGPPVSVGELCQIYSEDASRIIEAEVVGFRDRSVLSMPIYETGGIKLGDRIVSRRRKPAIGVGPGLLGRVVDGNGTPLDDKGPIQCVERYPLQNGSRNPL
ncbi:MAG TPA: hypothetical protein VKZ59_06220, partial [Acidobacteriota bacterium]|nr:hypothetical protein [Acidobacteriota bacterium]